MHRTAAPFRALAATAAISALLLAGCSGDDPEVEPTTGAGSDAESDTGAGADAESDTGAPDDDETASTQDASDDTAEETTGGDTEEESAVPSGPIASDDGAFEITAPEGWVDVRDQVEQQVEIAVRDDEMADDFFTNVVVASEEPIGDLEESIEAAAEQVAGADGEYELIDPIQIDGSDAYGFVLTRTTSGVEVAQTQWWVEHGERLYVATFSAAKTQQEATNPVMEEILSTWTWQD